MGNYLDKTGLTYFWGKLKNYFQPKLVSGTNIKTVNSQSLLGSGNINISGGGGISDVQVFDDEEEEVSVVENGIAKIPIADWETYGGVLIDDKGYGDLRIAYKTGTGVVGRSIPFLDDDTLVIPYRYTHFPYYILQGAFTIGGEGRFELETEGNSNVVIDKTLFVYDDGAGFQSLPIPRLYLYDATIGFDSEYGLYYSPQQGDWVTIGWDAYDSEYYDGNNYADFSYYILYHEVPVA